MARGPAYPYFDLEKGVNLTKALYAFAKKSPVSIDSVISEVLKMSPSSSSAQKSIAALKYFGLVDDAPGSKAKHIQLTERALQILFQPEGSPERRQALKEAALKPINYMYCWTKWGAEMQADAAMRSHLILEKHFVPTTVDGFLSDYKKTIEYAGLAEGDANSGNTGEPNSEDKIPPSIKIGDYVQWESAGVLQFDKPRKVLGLSPDCKYAFVEGSGTGIPTSQLTAEKAPELDGAALGAQAETPSLLRLNIPPPSALPKEVQPGMQQATMPLPEGDALLQWPKGMSKESYEDFETWVQLMLRKARRSIVKPSGVPEAPGTTNESSES